MSTSPAPHETAAATGSAPAAEVAALRAALQATQAELAEVRRTSELDSSLLSFFLDHVPDSVYFKDRASRFIRCSVSCAKPFGRAPADLVGKTDFDFYGHEEAASFMAAEQRIIETGVPLLGFLEESTVPGEPHAWKSTSKLPLRDCAGNVIGTFGLGRDVTAWKLLEEELLSAKNFYSALVESLPMMILRKDTAGRFTFVNQLFCAAVGRPGDALLGKTDADIFPAEPATRFRLDDLAIIAGGTRREYDEEFINAAGEKRCHHVIKLPLVNPDGSAAGIQAVFWDVTAQRCAEEQLKTVQRDLVEASRLAGMAEVASGVLHNVGNVLNSVNVSATLVGDLVKHSKSANLAKVSALLASRSGDLAAFLTTDARGRLLPDYLAELASHIDEERAATLAELDLLRKNIEHIKDIVAMQQTYARVSGVKEAHPAAALVEDAIRMNASALDRHAIALVRDFQPVPDVLVEKPKVLQILVNLLRNAKHAVDEAGGTERRVTVSIACPGAGRPVTIAVRDNGVGIARENLTRIFSFGFTTRKEGHGFGLHTSVLAARELGGALTVHSEGPGLGATFTLELPTQV